MSKYYFSGYSDDTINIAGDLDDEMYVYDKPGWISIKCPNGEGMMVFGQYSPYECPGGVWVFGVTMLDEAHNLPDWPVSITECENGYSTVLAIETPDDAVLSYREE